MLTYALVLKITLKIQSLLYNPEFRTVHATEVDIRTPRRYLIY